MSHIQAHLSQTHKPNIQGQFYCNISRHKLSLTKFAEDMKLEEILIIL